MVETVNISAGYGKREVLHGVDFYAGKGEITTLIGTGAVRVRCCVCFRGFFPFCPVM